MMFRAEEWAGTHKAQIPVSASAGTPGAKSPASSTPTISYGSASPSTGPSPMSPGRRCRHPGSSTAKPARLRRRSGRPPAVLHAPTGNCEADEFLFPHCARNQDSFCTAGMPSALTPASAGRGFITSATATIAGENLPPVEAVPGMAPALASTSCGRQCNHRCACLRQHALHNPLRFCPSACLRRRVAIRARP